jgi:hypothetical protein
VPGGRKRGLSHKFAVGGALREALPSAALTQVLDAASGPGRRGGADADERIGMLGRWDATEAWCAAAKLGVLAALIRDRAQPGYKLQQPSGLPTAWQDGLTEEVSMDLGISLRAADALLELAWNLEARLVLTREALAAGAISLAKARIIAEATSVLDDERAAAAETMIAGQLAGATHGQIAAMIARAVVKVDPEGARKRREKAQKEDARVRFWREHAGTAALAAFGLPSDEGLAANQHIQDRALAYKKAGMPGTMDQLRVRAFLDIINGADSRPAPGADDTTQASADDGEKGTEGASESTDGTEGNQSGDSDGGPGPGEEGNAPDGRSGPNGDGNGPNGNGGNGSGGPGSGPGGNGRPGSGGHGSGTGVAANVMLTVPLATLLGLAENPGEAQGLGALDPELARQMTRAATRHPRSAWCVTVTDEEGHAVAHGCARPIRTRRKPGHDGASGNRGSPQAAADGNGSRDEPALSFTPAGPGPPEGYGTWRLAAGGRDYTVQLMTIPVTSCDHRYESAGYRPGTLLRHLVEVRDGACTQPTCRRAARNCDFEHAVPWDQGGKTCACNGGCRCRRDHKVKQSPGWTVTQPKPGYHQWTTPTGRTYTSEPMRYPI